MTFHQLAYGPDDHLLVTLDGVELLAHDAESEAPRWRMSFERPLVAVLVAEASALPGAGGASPWRSNSTGRCLVAVDAGGGLHAIDPALGQALGTLGPFGKPVAVAAGPGAMVALATEDKVLLWRSGERAEIPGRTSCVAFSNDGATLALGAQDGSLRFLSVGPAAPLAETSCAVVHGGIGDLVQHPGGTWLAAGKSGLSAVTSTGAQRLPSVPAGVLRICLDGSGKRLAVQTSDRAILVYAWPRLEVETRIEYIERVVLGLSFGRDSWLGVALDHGDGNKIDVVTSATHRTDTHPTRTHRSWLLSVRGKETILSPQEADAVRRMKDPFHTPAPPRGSGTVGGRVGIGVAISVALLCLRVCAATSRSSSSYHPTYNPSALGTTSPFAAKCDRACAKQRLEMLRTQCVSRTCAAPTADAITALAAGDCKRAKSSLARIGTFPSSTASGSSDVLGEAMLSLAVRGLDDACPATSYGTVAVKHATLVLLDGPKLTASTESLPEVFPGEGEEPRGLWAAPDGTVFVATAADHHSRSNVYRRDKTGVWDVIARRRSSRPVQLWGRSTTDLYLMDADSLAHFDGVKTTEIAPPVATVTALGGIGEDVFVMGGQSSEEVDGAAVVPELHRRRGGAWATEHATTGGLRVRELWSGGGGLWARADFGDDDDSTDTADHILQRGPGGRWTERKLLAGKPASPLNLGALWVSPTADAFVATKEGVFRSTSGGAAWTRTGEPSEVEALWGRSNTDVYAIGGGGLVHYDGKTWSPTAYTHWASLLAGTPTGLVLAVAAEE